MRRLGTVIPELGKSLQVYPSEILGGMLGLPKVGDIFYVDPSVGATIIGAKNDPDSPYGTVYEAQADMAADNDDVIVIIGTSSTGRTAETQVIDWNKRRTHLIGNGPLRQINPRNGIGANYSGGSTTPVFKISATNCSFTNISIASFNDNDVLVEITAGNNTFNYVHFQGIAHATPAGETGARSLLITGAGENEFNHCTIGIDTVTRSAANASLEITGSSARNIFRNCIFPAFVSDAGNVWVKADTGNCNERFLLFENCLFTNATKGSSTAMTVGMDLSATGNGQIYIIGSRWFGATDLTNTVTDVYNDSPVFDTNDQGVLIVHANS